MNEAALYSGPQIVSVLSLLKTDNIEPAEVEMLNPLDYAFNSYENAIIWYSLLDSVSRNYLSKIDRYIATLEPGIHIEISKIVKPENYELFYKCLFYIILGANLFCDISFNSTYTVFKLNNPTINIKKT
jgi:hypothetical protein